MTTKKRKDDLIGGIRFVTLTILHDLPVAERLRHVLKQNGVGAVIINDEPLQARPPDERARASAPRDGFRIEVPDVMLEKAREILSKSETRIFERNDE